MVSKFLRSHHSGRSVDISSAPVRRHRQVAALVDDPRGLVDLESLARVLLPDPVAVGAFVLVEDVRSELAALVLPHLAAAVDYCRCC